MQNDGASNDAEVQLDEEITKVFTMDPDSNAETFDVSKLHDSSDMSEPRKYGEQEYFRECPVIYCINVYFWKRAKLDGREENINEK